MNPLRYLTKRRKRLAQREAERRHRIAEEARQKALDGPPLTEWEQVAMYGAVEAERNSQG